MSAPASALRIDSAEVGGAHVIRVEGELDLESCSEFELALASAEKAGAEWIVIDLERLSLIDSVGLGALMHATRRASAGGYQLQITRPHGHPRDLLRLTALDLTLPLIDPCLCPAIPETADRATPETA